MILASLHLLYSSGILYFNYPRFMQKFVKWHLAGTARRVLANHTPLIIGVTGSVGKSTTKEAVGTVLAAPKTRMSPRNYNTKRGVPLTIMGIERFPESNLGWLFLLAKTWFYSLRTHEDYPDTLILEIGSDRPGNIASLTDIAPPKIGIVTGVAESHAQNFLNMDAIAKEKGSLIERIPKDGYAVLNRDDNRVWEMRSRTSAKVVSYGFHEDADVRGIPESLKYIIGQDTENGMRMTVSAHGKTLEVFVPNTLGRTAMYSMLAAIAVGVIHGMQLPEIAEKIRAYDVPRGRLRYVPGIKHTTLIDDTYNAAPKSVNAALQVLMDVPVGAEDGCRIACLGDMLELGPLSKEGHRAVGARAAELGVDMLVLVGKHMRGAMDGALSADMSKDSIFTFETPEEAGRFVRDRLKKGDVILAKGSRGTHMELTLKELMANPEDAASELVRDID